MARNTVPSPVNLYEAMDGSIVGADSPDRMFTYRKKGQPVNKGVLRKAMEDAEIAAAAEVGDMLEQTKEIRPKTKERKPRTKKKGTRKPRPRSGRS